MIFYLKDPLLRKNIMLEIYVLFKMNFHMPMKDHIIIPSQSELHLSAMFNPQ